MEFKKSAESAGNISPADAADERRKNKRKK